MIRREILFADGFSKLSRRQHVDLLPQQLSDCCNDFWGSSDHDITLPTQFREEDPRRDGQFTWGTVPVGSTRAYLPYRRIGLSAIQGNSSTEKANTKVLTARSRSRVGSSSE